MKCLNCLKVYKGQQDLELNEHLSHLSEWGMCDDCDEGIVTMIKDKISAYYQKNKEHYKELHKGYKAKLTDSYVANMVADGTSLKAKEIPKQLVKGKRQQIQIKRLLKERKDGN